METIWQDLRYAARMLAKSPGFAVLDYAARTDMFDSAAAITFRNYNLTGTDQPVRLRSMRTTASGFPLLGVCPLARRVFTAAEDTYGGPHVVLLSQNASEHEIGVRMALGARPGGALRLVLSQALGMAVGGVATGLITAFFATRWLANQLYGIEPVDPATFMVVPALLTAAALAASSMPAWRATRVDPLVALRYE